MKFGLPLNFLILFSLCSSLCAGDHRLTDPIFAKHPLWVMGGAKPKWATSPSGSGYTPAQMRHAYGFDTITSTGTGQTIALVEAYGNPTMASDLTTFCTGLGLPAANLTIYNLQTTSGADASWALETALDVEWAHAIAPGAKLIVVEAASTSMTDLLAAVDYAVSMGATQVSMSWGGTEFSGETTFDSHFNVPGVTFFCATGDSGSGTEWPATSPYVVAVGGTTLNLDSTGDVLSEVGWASSSGGVSTYEVRPGFQNGFQTAAYRSVPDVSYNADPNTGVPVYISNYSGSSGWLMMGGTSAAAPQWAALTALANASRSAPLQALDAAVYSLAGSSYATNFRDVTSGSNGGYTAGVKYDLVTGLGSPLGRALVPALNGSTAAVPPPILGASVNGTKLANNAAESLGTVTQGAAAPTMSFVISNSGGSNLTITASTSTGSSLSGLYVSTGSSATIAAGANATVLVGLSTNSLGSFSANLVIASDDATQDPFTVALTGSVVTATPKIAVAQGTTAIATGGTLTFASTTVGAPVTSVITVSNPGSATLNLTSWSIASPFQISGTAPATLAAGASANVTLTYNALTQGTQTGKLLISNNTSSTAYTINLSGTSAAAPAPPKMSVTYSGGTVASGGTAAYGTTTAKTAVVKTFTVTNSGSGTLPITVKVTSSPATFFTILSTSSTSLTAGKSSTIQVQFDPTTAKTSCTGVFSVTTTVTGAGSYTANLTGASK